MKLRTKFLLSLLLVSSSLTCATLLVVRRTFQLQIRQVLSDDLRRSALTFQNFERDRQQNLNRSSALLASLPNLRALMTTQDAATIQDASGELWPVLGSDLFLLSNRSGALVALHAAAPGVTPALAQQWLAGGAQLKDRGWWFASGRLFEVFSHPVYFGSPSEEHLLGMLSVGYEVDQDLVREVAQIAGSEVAFEYGGAVAATTLPTASRAQVASLLDAAAERESLREIQLGRERFLAATVDLADTPAPVRLVVMKSLDQATAVLDRINEFLLALGIIAVGVGCGLAFLISHTFTRPLQQLVAGVRALELGNYEYPLENSKRDEVAELTGAFARMRGSLLTAQRGLLEAEQLATIGRMASSISHDLRHRLTAIVANSEFLAETVLDSAQREELYDEVRSAVRQMTDLLDSLLEFSRTPESLRLELVSVDDLVRRSLQAIRTHPNFQHIAVTVDCEPNLAGSFDAKKLERAFYNLLLNACEAVPREGGLIHIRARRLRDSVEIQVRDNGPGIPEPIRGELFKPFVSWGKQNGSGLGLAIVQKTCQDHGGEVAVADPSPGATTFRIVLPGAVSLAPHGYPEPAVLRKPQDQSASGPGVLS